MKIALVCPDDLSVVLFCKGLVHKLKDSGKNTVHVICDIWENDYPYYQEIEDWDVKFIYLKMYRFMNPIKDIKYILSLYRLFRNEKYDLVFPVTTKPNIYVPITAYYAKVKKIICGVWGFGVTITRNKTIWQKLVRMIFLSLYKYSFSKCTKVWFTNKYDANIDWVVESCGEEKLIVTKNYVNTSDYSIESIQKESIEDLREDLKMWLLWFHE